MQCRQLHETASSQSRGLMHLQGSKLSARGLAGGSVQSETRAAGQNLGRILETKDGK